MAMSILKGNVQTVQQDTRQAVKLIARLLRCSTDAAAIWIYESGFTEQQVIQIGSVIGASPFFDKPPKAQPRDAKALCPECGHWFHYKRVTRARMWCSEACRMRAHNRQFKKRLEKKMQYQYRPKPRRGRKIANAPKDFLDIP
jgi:hypothetical protein